MREDTPSTWVLWIHAASAARLEQSVRQNLEDLKVPRRADPASNAFQVLRGWLQDIKNGKWLLILDNVDDAQYLLEPPSNSKQQEDAALHERILDYFPASNQGSILVTSRTTVAALKVVERRSVIAVEPMNTAHAAELLRTKLDCDHTHEEALKLVEALDFMPLAINQAAAYISQEWPRCSVQKYLEELVESDKAKLSLLNLDDGDLRRDKEATNSIIATWQISFNQIRRVRSSAADLLSLMSFFDRQSIPEKILRECGTSTQSREHSPETVAQDFCLDVKILRSYSLITPATADTFTMHSLVQFTTRRWLQARSEEELWNERFVDSLYHAFPEYGGYEHWSTCAALYPHVKAASTLKPMDQNASKIWARLLYNCGMYARDRGPIADAQTMATLSTEEFFRLEGQKSKSAFHGMILLTRIGLENRSSANTIAGKLVAQMVATRKGVDGENEDMAAECRSLLARSHQLQGRSNGAEDIQVEVLKTLRRLLGDERYTMLCSMDYLAALYQRQQFYEEAADLEQHLVEIKKRVFGPQHRETLRSMGNLAFAYASLGQFDNAAILWTETLEIAQRVLGPDHPYTIDTLSNLASSFAKQKSYDKAIGMMSDAFETSKTVLGLEHSRTLIRMYNFAITLHASGRRQYARDLMELCAARSLDKLGPANPLTIECKRFARDWSMEPVDLGEGNVQSDANGGTQV
jgi:tetratricopeptide (TPR) repeat protein